MLLLIVVPTKVKIKVPVAVALLLLPVLGLSRKYVEYKIEEDFGCDPYGIGIPYPEPMTSEHLLLPAAASCCKRCGNIHSGHLDHTKVSQ